MPKQKLQKTLFNESEEKTAHFDTYRINNTTGKVKFSLKVGANGQSAVSDVYLDKEFLAEKEAGSIRDMEIGTNKGLRGKTLDIYTIVADVSTSTNLTKLQFTVEGGPQPYTYTLQKTVLEDGQSVAYQISIFFTIHSL